MGPQVISAVEISLHIFPVPRVPAQSLDAVLSFMRTATTPLATDIRFTPRSLFRRPLRKMFHECMDELIGRPV